MYENNGLNISRIASIITAIIYCLTGSEIRTIFNSFILAPVSWSWIFKPICDKLGVGYNTKLNIKTDVK